jgi:hypothetical protein
VRLMTALDSVAGGERLLPRRVIKWQGSATRIQVGRLTAALYLSARCPTSYFAIGELADATHTHLPFGIFTHVSVHRSCMSKGLPLGSVPLALKPPAAMAVLPKTVTCTFSYSALVNFVAFRSASPCALALTFPLLSVSTNRSS